jgi:hypothetical protein
MHLAERAALIEFLFAVAREIGGTRRVKVATASVRPA